MGCHYPGRVSIQTESPYMKDPSGKSMKTLSVVTALILVALLVPQAQAQANGQGITLTVDALNAAQTADGIAFSVATTIFLNVTVGCASVLSVGSATPSVAVTVTTKPVWLNFTAATIPVAPGADCANQGALGSFKRSGTLTVTPSSNAPGVTPTTITFTAVLTGSKPEPAASDTAELVDLKVAYRPGYTLSPDAQFPLTVTGDDATFNLTVRVNANAISMVMFDPPVVTAGTLDGLPSVDYNASETKIFKVTFTPPTGKWTHANATFFVYTHYRFGGDPMLGQNITWQFVNDNEDGGGSGNGKGKGAPGPTPVILALGLLALASLLRRR